MLELNKIYNADCLEVIKQIPDNSIDLILTDPPYNISKGRRSFTRDGKKINLDFGDWDKYSTEDYFSFITSYLTECFRIMKNNSSIYCCISPQFISYLKNIWLSTGGTDGHTIVWYKSNPVPHFLKCNWINSIELISYMKKGKPVFNFDLQKNMHNLFSTGVVSGFERTDHPTQKPIKLFRKFINVSSNPDDIVFDGFLGSGTTAIACIRSNRNYIGCEIDKGYFDIANKRIANELMKKEMELF